MSRLSYFFLKHTKIILYIAVILFSLGIATIISASDTLFESYTTGDDDQCAVFATDVCSQIFTPSEAHTLTSVILKLYKSGTPAVYDVQLKGTTAGKPSGGILCSGGDNGSTLPSGDPYEWREIFLTECPELEASTAYAILVSNADAGSSDRVYWRYDSQGEYTGGTFLASGDGGSNWTIYTNFDCMFKEYGTTEEPPPPPPSSTSTSEFIENASTGASFWLDKSISYGDMMIVVFLTLILIGLTFLSLFILIWK